MVVDWGCADFVDLAAEASLVYYGTVQDSKVSLYCQYVSYLTSSIRPTTKPARFVQGRQPHFLCLSTTVCPLSFQTATN